MFVAGMIVCVTVCSFAYIHPAGSASDNFVVISTCRCPALPKVSEGAFTRSPDRMPSLRAPPMLQRGEP